MSWINRRVRGFRLIDLVAVGLLAGLILGGMAQLSYDTAGRITLPEILCQQFGLTDWVVVVGLGDRFQIWQREAFQTHRAAQREVAREGLATMRAQQRAARLGSVG